MQLLLTALIVDGPGVEGLENGHGREQGKDAAGPGAHRRQRLDEKPAVQAFANVTVGTGLLSIPQADAKAGVLTEDEVLQWLAEAVVVVDHAGRVDGGGESGWGISHCRGCSNGCSSRGHKGGIDRLHGRIRGGCKLLVLSVSNLRTRQRCSVVEWVAVIS